MTFTKDLCTALESLSGVLCPRLGVVGPYFFEEGGETVTGTSNRYCEMLENFLRPRLAEFDDSEDFWFQLGILREMFPSRLISLRDDIGWPARCPI